MVSIDIKDGFVGFRFIVINQKLTAQDFYNGYLNGQKSEVIFKSVSNTIKDNIFFSKINKAEKWFFSLGAAHVLKENAILPYMAKWKIW